MHDAIAGHVFMNMEVFREEPEFTDIRVFKRVMDMFEGRSQMQRIIKHGLLGMEYDELDDSGEDDYEFNNWAHCYNHFHGYTRYAEMSDNRELSGNRTRSKESVYQPPLQYWTTRDIFRQTPIKVQPKESNTERRPHLLQETKKSKEKALKKRLKKQKQKERRRFEKVEKEEPNPDKMEEEKVDAQQSEAEGNKSVNEKSKDDTNSSNKALASVEHAESSDSSEDELDHEDIDTKNDSDAEELDMTSTFVKLAKLKLEQKPKPEKKEKKKIPVKEERKSVPNKANEVPEVEKKDSAASRSPTIEENIKMSTELAIIGNTFAGSGDYPMAVKYFTDAIKFNPTEFKLFGNRSFCFEKMQEYEKALTDAELCLRLCPGWVKGLFRKGRALAGLKRYEEAAQAFEEVLQLDSAFGEAAQELMRMQITQLMEYGFTLEQSTKALIIHGTVKKALEVLTKLNPQPGASQNATLPVQVANVTGVSPVLSASTSPAPACPKDAPLKNNLFGPVQNMSNVHQHKPILNQATVSSSQVNQTPLELFPVWVGNLFYPVSESLLANLFNKVGFVYSVKVLTVRRCAFVNYTKQEHCEEAIRRFHGFDLNGTKIAVRYPDRIPHGMGISKSALIADDQQDQNMRQNEYGDERNAVGGRRPLHTYRHVPDHKNRNEMP